MAKIIETEQTIKKNQLPIRGANDLISLGSCIANSGMFGNCLPARGAVVAAICYQENMSLLDFLRWYHLTNDGKITMRADRMMAEYQRLGGTIVWKETSEEKAEAVCSYAENKNVTVSYTIDEAKKAGYIRDKSNWTKDPASQLRARVITRAVRMLCPAATAGVYTPEEMADNAIDMEMQIQQPQEQEIMRPAELAAQDQSNMPDPWTQNKTTNFELCPVEGIYFKKRWDAMPTEHLHLALTIANLENGHYEAINKAIAERERNHG